MVINGKNITLDGAKTPTLKTYLEDAGYDLGQIAVEKNGVIIPKNDFDGETLSDGDVIEIVRFVGGG